MHISDEERELRFVSEPSCLPQSDDRRNETGLVVSDLSLRPIYWNHPAVAALIYPHKVASLAVPAGFIQERLRSMFRADEVRHWVAVDFRSGRRLYTCLPSVLPCRDDGSRSPIVAFSLQRRAREPVLLCGTIERFHLSKRESETVQHLIHGLTTKETARLMNVSPNTIKQFVRLIMTKMGVTTRAGIIGKLVQG